MQLKRNEDPYLYEINPWTSRKVSNEECSHAEKDGQGICLECGKDCYCWHDEVDGTRCKQCGEEVNP